MTKYKEIIGTDIEVVTTDPTVTGQVWYNESEGELKTRNQFVGSAWSIGGSLNTARDFIGRVDKIEFQTLSLGVVLVGQK